MVCLPCLEDAKKLLFLSEQAWAADERNKIQLNPDLVSQQVHQEHR